MSNTSTIHIKTDFDCKVYDYGQGLGTTKADTYFNIELRKGEHELSFAFTEDESISKSINYMVEDVDCDYRLIVEIAEVIYEKANQLYDLKDFFAAFVLYLIIAERGFVMAEYRVGNCYYNGTGVEKDFAKAVEWYTKGAEQGLATAQCDLGDCYYSGTGIEKDLAKATEWYTKAAEQGFSTAQFNLGVCYNNGSGVEQNLAKAVEWYIKATEQGNAQAQNNLGVCYEYGIGVEKNHAKAVEWYIKAAQQGNATAQNNLGVCYEHGTGIEKNLSKAVEWYTKAAEQGNATAQDNLGSCYEFGTGVEQSLAKAVEWYTKAAEQGLATAQLNLGSCYEIGGIKVDCAKAVEWYTKAAEQGLPTAQFNLGVCYENGEGVEKDLAKAVEWYTKAAEQGNENAQFNLGVCYEDGNGIEINLTKAIEWYSKAAEQGDENAINALNRLKSIETKQIHYLFFNTETAGLPRDYYAPTCDSMNWPRLVQLSWVTTDDCCNMLSQHAFIIYPDRFTIPFDTAKQLGITTDIAKEKGKPLEEVIEKFMEDFETAQIIVGHNIAFDKKIVGAELVRLGQNDIMDSKESLCTMEASTNYCKIPDHHGYKYPKLQELHKKLFGYKFEDAHNSMSDVKATLKCFKKMKKLGWI